MHMTRFIAIETIKEKTIRTLNVFDCWHIGTFITR
jgi:hypothetical protein